MTNNQQEIDFLFDDFEEIFKECENKKTDLFNHFAELMERMEKEKYVGHVRSIRQHEAKTKKVTSIAIHGNNQKIIHELQKEAKDEGFFLSKENIINMGLQSLHKEVSRNGNSIHELFLKYK